MNATQAPSDQLTRLANEAGVEWVNGGIVEKPTNIESSEVEARILSLLMTGARRGSAHVFPPSMGYRSARHPYDIRKPDVSLVQKHRIRNVDRDSAFVPIPPDLAIEVLTPTDLASELKERINAYLRDGIPLIWVVHPQSRTVVVHRAGGTASVLSESDEITGESALPGFRCKVAEFFAALT